jgi:deazaflavin-dependent oxidoreductase (nitroreductase family)
VTGGRLGGRIVGMPVLLLTTTGRRSGRSHHVGLTYVPHGSGYAVIGSNGGASNHPDWLLNLRASPRAAVQIRDRTSLVQAREAAGAERHRLWEMAAAAYSGYDAYRKRSGRKIPVVILEPLSGLYERS